MVTPRERRLIAWLVKIKRFELYVYFRTVQIKSRWGTRWLLKRIRKRQIVDDLHHAPCCPANHFCRMRIVFQHCNCGAQHYENQKKREEAEEEKRLVAAKYSVFAQEASSA